MPSLAALLRRVAARIAGRTPLTGHGDVDVPDAVAKTKVESARPSQAAISTNRELARQAMKAAGRGRPSDTDPK